MASFHVSTQGKPPVVVEGANWISALGAGLEAFGAAALIDRLACEVLPNGTVIARDARRGTGFVIQPDRAGPRVTIERPDDPPFSMGPEETTEEVAMLPPSSARSFPAGWRVVLEATHSVQAAWDRALDVARRVVPAEAGAGFGLLPGGGLRFLAAWGQHAGRLRGQPLPPGVGIVGFCVGSNTSLIVHNVPGDARFYRDLDQATGFSTREILCVPVSLGDQLRGCIELLNPIGAAGFCADDIVAIEVVTAALGARLHELATPRALALLDGD